MPRQCSILLVLMTALACVASGQNVLALDPISGSLTVEASPLSPGADAHTLTTTGVIAAAYAAVWNRNGWVSNAGQCTLPGGSSLKLQTTPDGAYVMVVVNAASTTITANGTTFGQIGPGDDGLAASVVQGYAPLSLAVSGGTGDTCNTFASYTLQTGEYWGITQVPPPVAVHVFGYDGGDSGGGGIPIVGNSLRIQSPQNFKCVDSSSCRLEGWGEALRLEKVRHFSPPDVSLSLDGAVSWTITTDPPTLKIVKEFLSKKLLFNALSPYKLSPTNAGGISILDVVDQQGNKIKRPQQFMVTWYSGLFGEAEVIVSCGGANCQLQLVTKKMAGAKK